MVLPRYFGSQRVNQNELLLLSVIGPETSLKSVAAALAAPEKDQERIEVELRPSDWTQSHLDAFNFVRVRRPASISSESDSPTPSGSVSAYTLRQQHLILLQRPLEGLSRLDLNLSKKSPRTKVV
jgi:hypothetical protein